MAKNGFSMSNRVAVEEITASKTLTADDCGKVFVMASASAAYTVTLPQASAAQVGWNCALVIGATAKDHVVTGSSDESAANIHIVGAGSDIAGGTSYSGSAGTAVSEIAFVGANIKRGDRVELVTDGSVWYGKILTLAQDAYSLS